MRAPSRVAFVAWFVISAGGCAAVTGLDQISEEECAPLCDGGVVGKDVTTDTPGNDVVTSQDVVGTQDQSAGDDAAEDTTEPQETSTTDAPNETSTEGGVDAPVDSPADTGHDTGTEAGCGSTDTVQNCGACGQACTETNASADSCNGTTCSYTCKSGYLDCNEGTAPDTDGCECTAPAGATQANCGNGTNGPLGCCPVAHNDGLSEGTPKFFDCNTGYSLSLAIDACANFTGNASECTQGQCEASDGAADGDLVVCATGSTTDCPCWTFSGPNEGYVHDPHAAPGSQDQNCYCASKTLGDTSYD